MKNVNAGLFEASTDKIPSRIQQDTANIIHERIVYRQDPYFCILKSKQTVRKGVLSF